MKTSIIKEMSFHQKVQAYSIKYKNNTKDSRKYKTRL